MSDEKRLAVEMTWTMTKKFTVTVPSDTAKDEIETIFYDLEDEFLDTSAAVVMPCVVDSEETVAITALGDEKIEFQNVSFEEVTNG